MTSKVVEESHRASPVNERLSRHEFALPSSNNLLAALLHRNLHLAGRGDSVGTLPFWNSEIEVPQKINSELVETSAASNSFKNLRGNSVPGIITRSELRTPVRSAVPVR